MRIVNFLVLGVIGITPPIQFTAAEADSEYAAPARIVHKLEVLEPLIGEAEAQANRDTCILFCYD